MTELLAPTIWKLSPTPPGYQISPFFEDHTFATLDEASLQLPGGAYTTFRTYSNTRALRLEDHFNRLNESAQRASAHVRINPDEVRACIRAILHQLEARDYRFRLTLDLEREPGSIYLAAEPLHVPSPEEYAQGVKVISRIMHRKNPKAKLSGFIKDAHQIRKQLPPGINETLMVRGDGMILEGLSSNFFGIQSSILHTSKEGVLPGITQAVLLDICREAEIKVRNEGVFLSNISTLEEAFITSASRAVLPVVQIDQTQIGTGHPGETTRRLMALFQERIEQESHEI